MELMQRAQSPAESAALKISMCGVAVRNENFEPAGIHVFVVVTPMDDADIVLPAARGR